jgi:hypothetical protein
VAAIPLPNSAQTILRRSYPNMLQVRSVQNDDGRKSIRLFARWLGTADDPDAKPNLTPVPNQPTRRRNP